MNLSLEDFIRKIKEDLLIQLKEYEVIGINDNKVLKNNGISLTGISILRKDSNIAPTFYLDDMYMLYRKGKSYEELLEYLISSYIKKNDIQLEEPLEIYDYDLIKEKVFLRIVNMERNQEMLKDCPYIKFLDLALTFRVLVTNDDGGIGSILIRNNEINKWNISTEDLYKIAYMNTKSIFPLYVESLTDMLNKAFPNECFPDENPLYILSNNKKINGATMIIYEDILDGFASDINESFYIIPSSIHEGATRFAA